MSAPLTISYTGPSPLGEDGYRTGLEWNTNSRARARVAEVIAEHRAERTEVVLDAHLRSEWAAHAVRAPDCSPPCRRRSARRSLSRTPF